MNDIILLMAFPFVIACILLIVKDDRVRGIVSEIGAAAIMVLSVAVSINYVGRPQTFEFSSEAIDLAMFVTEAVLGLAIIYLGARYRKYTASVLGAVQLILSIAFELYFKKGIEVERGLYIDDLSVLMILIIGIVGSLICVYAIGYMRDFQQHHGDGPDRRPRFFFLLFVFLSAMFGIVLSNNLVWMFFFWEITTLCSFALIGYTKTEEARDNSFRQLTLNLIGGIAFIGALMALADREGILSLEELLSAPGGAEGYVLLAVMLLALAGIVKSAQMPFHTWLLGAMVAPTPTSALLHSSTMVKAGVFMLLKLSPLLHGNIGGDMVMAVGGITFLLASMAAVSQSNAKRVLAYSTIANLGLIVACAGVGTPEAVWAGVMLTVFHAITKSLLFLCVGTAEHHIGSRDIEDMDGLFERMPRLARIMMIGIAAMFLAPFGMLISKWSAMTAFVDPENPLSVLLIGCIAFGSAVTGFYWTKWLGKLSYSAKGEEDIEGSVRPQERTVLVSLVVMAVLVCFAFPLVSDTVIEPWISMAFLQDPSVGILQDMNMLLIMVFIVALVLMFVPFFGRNGVPESGVYMSGVGIDDSSYHGSMGSTVEVSLRNWYMEGWFGEDRIGKIGEAVTGLTLAVCIAVTVWGCMI